MAGHNDGVSGYNQVAVAMTELHVFVLQRRSNFSTSDQKPNINFNSTDNNCYLRHSMVFLLSAVHCPLSQLDSFRRFLFSINPHPLSIAPLLSVVQGKASVPLSS
jgi:hypothetical protein